jgi:D-glycero-alpha-D-manno-heptose-7-phosphate kinase
MIICQTPLRVSFFGGGTDFPEFFEQHGGAVLAAAIDKYIYHSVTQFPSALFDYSIRLAYRKVECVKNVSEIEHGPFREILKSLDIERDVEISLAADLPAFSGLGSSSSFTVGLIHSLMAFRGQFISKSELAYRAINIERNVLHDAVGCQDPVMAAYGGLDLVHFSREDDISVTRIPLRRDRLQELDNSLLLFFTGITRRAGDLERNKLNRLGEIQKNLKVMLNLVEQAHSLLTGNAPLSEFGRLLDSTWNEKRCLHPGVSNPQIDHMYETGIRAGALGGKLLGAGGGGFMLFFVPPERHEAMRAQMHQYFEVPFHIGAAGSSIIHS